MKYAVKVEQLSKSYGSIDAVKEVSFAIPAGTAFGLLGPNGSGKSTVVECVVGTKVPDKGSIEVMQLNPHRDRKRLFQSCGVQFQDCDYQPEIKVSELCEEFACLYDNPADWRELCNRFGIGDKTTEAVKSLSGGQRQKLFIVLTLLSDPKVVFLDELTTGLDAAARRSVWELLNGLKRNGVTLFLVSHFMDEVEAICDRICVLRNGSVVFLGTPEEAKEATGESTLEDAYLILTSEKGE